MPTTGATITLGTKPRSEYQGFVVDRDIGQPDTAEVILSGLGEDLKLGDSATIEYGNNLIYSGEIIDITNAYGEGKSHTRVRAMNQLHRLNRGRRSHVFPKKDQDRGPEEKDVFEGLLQLLAEEVKLKSGWDDKNPEIVHPGPVLWTNQTPMEFLAMRAERYGYHIWCVGDMLYCKVPDLSKESNFDLIYGGSGSVSGGTVELPVTSFEARMSSSQVVKKVIVRGTNPVTGQANEDKADIGTRRSPLGEEHATKEYGSKDTYIVDFPVSSKPEAKAIADADFLRRSLTFITAEAIVDLNPKLELGKTVGVSVSPGRDPFNGRYYVKGMTHRFTAKHGQKESYITDLRLVRDAQFAPPGRR